MTASVLSPAKLKQASSAPMPSKLKQSLASARDMELILGNVLAVAVQEAAAPFQAKIDRLEAENRALKARLSAFEARSELAGEQEPSGGSEKTPADDAEEAQMEDEGTLEPTIRTSADRDAAEKINW